LRKVVFREGMLQSVINRNLGSGLFVIGFNRPL